VTTGYPIPNLQHFHQRLANSEVFSKIDLVKAYHFIPVKPEHIEKTAISTPFGSFEYRRMPFGLRNSSGTFQRFIDSHLRDFHFALSYLDDILIFSRSIEEHREHLTSVLTRLQSIGLRVNDKKCEFLKPKLNFLGFEIDKDGIKPPASRIESLSQLPPPTDSKMVTKVLGMFGFYRRCIPRFADITHPLRLLANAKDFSWTDEHQNAYNDLKTALASSAQLTFPSKEGHMTITADASKHAIGACLNQMQDGDSKPLSFFSRSLSKSEQSFSAFDRELLAIFAAVKRWKDIIDGGNVTVFTDHKPIVGAFRNANARDSHKQQRQLSFISEYVSDVVHVAGKDNVVADALSRLPDAIAHISQDDTPSIPNCDLSEIARQQALTPSEYTIYSKFDIGTGNPLFCETSHPNPRPVVPEKLRFSIFKALHELSHSGAKSTARMVNSRYFWFNVKRDVQKWCKECLACQSSKVGRHTKKPISYLPCPTQRFANVHMDIVGPLDPPDSHDNQKPRYLLTMIDYYTRWLEVAPLIDISSKSISHSFLSCWISRFGPPVTLTTDRGTQFTSELMANLNNLLGIHHIRTCAFNPRANGAIERAHRTLKAALKARGHNWLQQLPVVMLGIRTRPDEDGNSPFNYKPPRQRSATTFLPDKLATCSHVWVRVDRVRRPLEAPYQGPYVVKKRCGNTFTILIRGRDTVVSIDRLKPATLPPAAIEKNEDSDAHGQNIDQKVIRQDTGEDKKMDDEKTDDAKTGEKKTTTTRSGRKIRFKEDATYNYY